MLTDQDTSQVLKQLQQLSFNAKQSRNAVTAMSTPSSLTTYLLRIHPPLQACIEYLILHVPECDLPQRFLPTNNSSNPFIMSAHAGEHDLQRRWMEEKAIKECGWPLHVVKECMSDPVLSGDWRSLVSALNRRLLGEESAEDTILPDATEHVDLEEVEALAGHIIDLQQFVIPLPVAPMILNVIASPNHEVPTKGTPAPMYITSSSVPAYVRLHLLSKLLLAFKAETLFEEGESFVMASMRLLEEEWAVIEDDGPPAISEVLKHMLPRTHDFSVVEKSVFDDGSQRPFGNQRRHFRRRDDRSDSRIKEEFEQTCQKAEYKSLLSVRERLPAFSAKDHFLDLLERHQCVVVVGETGKHSSSNLCCNNAQPPPQAVVKPRSVCSIICERS